QLLEEGADLITFTSSSTVENFLALGLPWPKGMQVASIGPITSKTARDHGLKIDIEARSHDIDGLVQAIRDFFEREGLFYRPGDGINRLYLRQRATFGVFEFWNPLSTNPKSLGWIKSEPPMNTLAGR